MYQMISRFLKCIGDSLSCFVARLDVSAVIVNDPNRRVPWVGPRRKGNMRYHPDSCTCIDRLSWLQAWLQNYRALPTHNYIRILYSLNLAMHTTEVLFISVTAPTACRTRSATSQWNPERAFATHPEPREENPPLIKLYKNE